MWIEFLLEVCFHFTLFFLFIIVFLSLIKKFMPFIEQQILISKKRAQDLEDKESLLIASRRRLEGQILSQTSNFDLLEEKVIKWKEFQELKNKEYESENSDLIQKIKVKRDGQFSHLRLLKMQKRITPEAFKQVFIEIEKIHSREKGKALLNELIDKIEPQKTNG